MKMTKLRHRIEVWGEQEITGSYGEDDFENVLIKTVWAEIRPQTARLLKGEAETILSNTTHKVVLRYSAGKDIKQNYHFKFKEKRFDIKYILNPYFKNEFLEIFCTERIE